MTLQTPDVHSVLERVEKLEKENRRLKCVGVVALASIGVLVLMGQAAPKSKTLEAQELILRDPSGRLRIALGAYQDGPRLVLTGDDQRPRVDVAVKEGSPMLQTLDADGRVTWSAPSAPVGEMNAKPERRPRVFIEHNVAGMVLKGSNTPAELTALFGQICPQAVLTIDQGRADYTWLTHQWLHERWVYDYTILRADGTVVSASSNLSSERDAATAACRDLLADWKGNR